MRGKSKEIQSTPEGAYRFGEFEVYPSERQLHRQNIEAPLPPKAFDALMILVRKAGQLVRKEELIEALWPETYVTEANLTNIVVILRKVLGHGAIQTASKYGWRPGVRYGGVRRSAGQVSRSSVLLPAGGGWSNTLGRRLYRCSKNIVDPC
jgi:DNA-binding response OmpR family regulator